MGNYKLVTQDMTTYNHCKWEVGVKKITSGEGDLCGSGWLHYYSNPLLAVLFNPIHTDYKNPRLFLADVGGRILHDGQLKSGASEMTLIKEIELPIITTTQRIAFAILCALEVYKAPDFVIWATNWLPGKDRTAESAWVAWAVAEVWAEAVKRKIDIDFVALAEKAINMY